ncbi:hypothetical protein SERLA73DRAFT_169404 [Serpula lacrymans var. lacrymans S7.3]|uniref:Uncharacterized protein n=2 Tax=Serpula lacrymans var. lacrymans TaxID=341189 RepID=F8PZX2_SERL3|nr:uncharacterized protein SERLADRAFT_450314 [Serpula lacrymans var. lacrymans S7.9]EGN98444.1 hypothetical protein SERLA73DRAFT_169404 [Serpula lacrymans var. lacrymans S7.3]EGO24023.1 hypothetical protein SERLADRAFT_450314 [Serpula lacrymans var. lacrymans S7.9]
MFIQTRKIPESYVGILRITHNLDQGSTPPTGLEQDERGGKWQVRELQVESILVNLNLVHI